ncbi:N-acetylmuramoyl-L-alanine amidase [Streptomyces sp. JJ66]|nr:N-acetylmuramoyl-L-alanine amidase [Streptomyces sp. JJ66]
MATPLSADRLLSALRAEGVRVVEVGNWHTHNRNHKGAWGPVNGIIVHHTVTSGSRRTVDICRNGYSGLPGPLCHGVITKDGRVHLVGHGRANHAGRGDSTVLGAVIAERAAPRPQADTTDGNARFYGFECENLGDGRDPWPAVQVEAIARASAAICRAHGWNERSVIGHAEWTRTKIDPRGPGLSATQFMDRIRGRVRELLATPAGNGEKETDMALDNADLDRISDRVWKKDGHPVAWGTESNPAWAAISMLHYACDLGRQNRTLIKGVAAAVAQLAAQGAARDAVLAALAQDGGLTAEQVEAAAASGARAALAELGERLADDAA